MGFSVILLTEYNAIAHRFLLPSFYKFIGALHFAVGSFQLVKLAIIMDNAVIVM